MSTSASLEVPVSMSVSVYISEGQDAAMLSRLEAEARRAAGARVALAHLFVDRPYHRSNFTLTSACPDSLAGAVLALARAALALVDLQRHAATHPRLGAVDHISCHPLADAGGAPLQACAPAAAALVARSVARQLGSAGLPVYTYGAAHQHQRPLDDIRRQLGYFKGAASGQWEGLLGGGAAGAEDSSNSSRGGGAVQRGGSLELAVRPCFGPGVSSAASGVCCIGAIPLIINYNVSERGGGLPAVQAMALRHATVIEVACNLLDARQSSPADVLVRIEQLAAAAGVEVGGGYVTGKTAEQLLQTVPPLL
eukprot:scaffold6.g2863.t1